MKCGTILCVVSGLVWWFSLFFLVYYARGLVPALLFTGIIFSSAVFLWGLSMD